MPKLSVSCTCLLLLAAACGGDSEYGESAGQPAQLASTGTGGEQQNGGTPARAASGLAEGGDYLVLERVRILAKWASTGPSKR